MKQASDNRRIEFEGVANFRDLGGYETADGRTIRWRHLFRSDALHHMTERDAIRARDGLGIRTIIDLRTLEAIQREGIGPLGRPPMIRHHFPLIDRSWGSRWKIPLEQISSSQLYQSIIDAGGTQIAAAIQLLADSRAYPAVFHCYAGKDRTGVLAAVILGTLGVDEEQIVEDYEMSNQTVGQVIEHMRYDYGPYMEKVPPSLLEVKPEALRDTLLAVRYKYGSMRDYAHSVGVTETLIQRLERALLEPKA